MPAAPLPVDELARLRELRHYQVLDTLPDPSFDRLTRLASQIAGVPIGLISLTDASRQWFKSRVGIDVAEIPRDWAPCAHVVACGESIVCPDMSADPRFADNPLVTGAPKFRFYAGLALRTPRGAIIGTLAVLDTKPGELTSLQVEGLTTLAQQIVDELELRTAYRELGALRAREREFETRLLRERSDEAQRLAAELHDGVGQELAGISILLGATINEARRTDSALVPPLDEISRLLTHAIDSARRAAEQQGGFAVQAGGLAGAIEQFVRRIDQPGGPRIALDAAPIPPGCLDDSSAYHLLRITQEAVLNARKHSRGRLIRVSCGHDEGIVRVVVRDDGVGLPDDIGSRPGLGRHIMAYRAKKIGATLTHASSAGGGLAVTCELRAAALDEDGAIPH
ncbi:MAG: GAF domain-containing protein [Proteobacteria bacterium]|nr:GAF domain-containing protein [Pseudomonadota bacterium]